MRDEGNEIGKVWKRIDVRKNTPWASNCRILLQRSEVMHVLINRIRSEDCENRQTVSAEVSLGE